MRHVLKSVIVAIVFLAVLPSGLLALIVRRAFGSTLAYDFLAHVYAVAPGLPGKYIRSCYYNLTLARSDLSADYAFGSLVTKMEADIGPRVYLGLYTSVGYAEIGEDAVLANYVSVLSGGRQHNFDDPDRPIFANEDVFSKVTIGANSFFGDKATVMANVGRCTIIGAGAVVVKDIPDYVVAVGNPARVIKERRPDASAPPTRPE
jgi:acetyltransferase-like isoleucine patch superfamily enzyme